VPGYSHRHIEEAVSREFCNKALRLAVYSITLGDADRQPPLWWGRGERVFPAEPGGDSECIEGKGAGEGICKCLSYHGLYMK